MEKPIEVERFRAMLLAKRREIVRNVLELKDEASSTSAPENGPRMPIHPGDVGSDCNEVEDLMGLMTSEQCIFRDIDRALECMDQGTYGACEACHIQIPLKRLEAIPWARYCIDCSDAIDQTSYSASKRSLRMRRMSS